MNDREIERAERAYEALCEYGPRRREVWCKCGNPDMPGSCPGWRSCPLWDEEEPEKKE